MVTVLPPLHGYLPLWLLIVSATTFFNSAQAYTSLKLTKRLYSAQPSQVTGLSARTFGTWTLLTCIVRLYAAYYISEPHVYQLALSTYAIAAVHFLSEWKVYRTIAWGPGLVPIFVSTGTAIWMLTQWSFYVA